VAVFPTTPSCLVSSLAKACLIAERKTLHTVLGLLWTNGIKLPGSKMKEKGFRTPLAFCGQSCNCSDEDLALSGPESGPHRSKQRVDTSGSNNFKNSTTLGWPGQKAFEMERRCARKHLLGSIQKEHCQFLITELL
jgi:hypothetical protein